jgi:DNA-binding beta-propeller fold protein YncE
MSTISNSQFFAGTRFVEGLQVPTYWAVRPDRSEVVACANIASARTISEDRAPSRDTDTNGSFTYKAVPFVSPTGQYYVEIHAGSQVVRMDVANAQTARHYGRNGVDTRTTTNAYLENLSR